MTKFCFNWITFYTNLGNSESDRYRVFNTIEALTKKGIQCRFLSLLSTQEQIDEGVKNTDVFVFFRTEMNSRVARIINELKKKNTPIIFDIDDLIFDINDPKRSIHAAQILETMEKCNILTATTQTLVNNSPIKGRVIRNTINPNQLKLSEELIKNKNFHNDTVKIGYFSGTSSHEADFKECSQALLKILYEFNNVELHVVGFLNTDNDFDKYKNQIKKIPFMNYLKMLEYLSQMDINIAPLEKNSFNDSKSELKIFESALVLVPSITSRVKSYENSVKEGLNGYLASSNNEWLEKLRLLINNPVLRKDIAHQARKDFIQKFYIDNNIEQIIDIYNSVLNSTNEPQLFTPQECYKNFCSSLKLEYSNQDLEELNLLNLFYKEEQGFNTLIFNEIKTAAFKNKIKCFIKENKNKRICFWGGGKFFQHILSKFDFSELNIVGVIDKNPNANNFNVITPEKIKELKPDLIILSVIKPHLIENFVVNYLTENNIEVELSNCIDLWFSKEHE